MKFLINGVARETSSDPRTPVLLVLRNEFQQHDVRQGCGEGHCGACMVLVDGRPTTTCDLPLWGIEGKAVVSLRGLGSPRRPHPVQLAMLEEQASQCGYCLSGIIVTASTLLGREVKPTETEVRNALDRHLCRCGTHRRIIDAVMNAVNSEGMAPDGSQRHANRSEQNLEA